MTSAAPAALAAADNDLPCPADTLQARFATIWREQMHDVPMVNPRLRVQAVGFVPWDQHWLGVLVTPWFMNLVLMPRVAAHWHAIGERQSRHHVFPAGVFEFISNQDAVLGNYQACSLFSPMFEFADHDAAVATATSALAALFDAGSRQAVDVPAAQTQTQAQAQAQAAVQGATPGATAAPATAERPVAPEPKTALSKRDFLFGGKARADRGT